MRPQRGPKREEEGWCNALTKTKQQKLDFLAFFFFCVFLFTCSSLYTLSACKSRPAGFPSILLFLRSILFPLNPTGSSASLLPLPLPLPLPRSRCGAPGWPHPPGGQRQCRHRLSSPLPGTVGVRLGTPRLRLRPQHPRAWRGGARAGGARRAQTQRPQSLPARRTILLHRRRRPHQSRGARGRRGRGARGARPAWTSQGCGSGHGRSLRPVVLICGG